MKYSCIMRFALACFLLPLLLIGCTKLYTNTNKDILATETRSTAQATHVIKNAQDVITELKNANLVISDDIPEDSNTSALKNLVEDVKIFYVVDKGRKYIGSVVLCQTEDACDNLYNGDKIAMTQGGLGMWRNQSKRILCKIQIRSNIFGDQSNQNHLSDMVIKTIKTTIESLP